MNLVYIIAWLTRMRQQVTFGDLSNDVDTTGTGPMHVVASRLGNILRLSSVVLEGSTYGRQPPTRKSIRFWTEN
jgi:hypothetical protein